MHTIDRQQVRRYEREIVKLSLICGSRSTGRTGPGRAEWTEHVADGRIHSTMPRSPFAGGTRGSVTSRTSRHAAPPPPHSCAPTKHRLNAQIRASTVDRRAVQRGTGPQDLATEEKRWWLQCVFLGFCDGLRDEGGWHSARPPPATVPPRSFTRLPYTLTLQVSAEASDAGLPHLSLARPDHWPLYEYKRIDNKMHVCGLRNDLPHRLCLSRQRQ